MMRCLLISFILLVAQASAHDMNESYADWYKSLEVPGSSNGFGGQPHYCCNQGDKSLPEDCKNVETRTVKDPDGSMHLEAFADSKLFDDAKVPWDTPYGHAPNKWVRVPDTAIIHGKDNPTGSPVGCWFDHNWRCFIEGTKA
jgi:hypothetical protein